MCQQEHYKLKGQIFGQLNTLSKQEYRAFYEATGIDLDDRRQMVKGLTVVMEQGIMRYIQFAKAIPEFETLSLDDQASLIKSKLIQAILGKWMCEIMHVTHVIL